jgi:hypothetical protein
MNQKNKEILSKKISDTLANYLRNNQIGLRDAGKLSEIMLRIMDESPTLGGFKEELKKNKIFKSKSAAKLYDDILRNI